LPAALSGAVGLGAFAFAGVFWALRQGTISDVLASCKSPQSYSNCNPGLRGIADHGRTDTVVSEALVGAGIAGVAAAGLLLIWEPTKTDSRAPTARRMAVEVGVSPIGIETTTTF